MSRYLQNLIELDNKLGREIREIHVFRLKDILVE